MVSQLLFPIIYNRIRLNNPLIVVSLIKSDYFTNSSAVKEEINIRNRREGIRQHR